MSDLKSETTPVKPIEDFVEVSPTEIVQKEIEALKSVSPDEKKQKTPVLTLGQRYKEMLHTIDPTYNKIIRVITDRIEAGIKNGDDEELLIKCDEIVLKEEWIWKHRDPSQTFLRVRKYFHTIDVDIAIARDGYGDSHLPMGILVRFPDRMGDAYVWMYLPHLAPPQSNNKKN